MQKNKDFCHFVWPFFLSKNKGLAKNGYDHENGHKKLCGNPWSKLKSSSDDPKTAIFHFLSFFWPRPGKGLNPKALYLRPLPFSRMNFLKHSCKWASEKNSCKGYCKDRFRDGEVNKRPIKNIFCIRIHVLKIYLTDKYTYRSFILS